MVKNKKVTDDAGRGTAPAGTVAKDATTAPQEEKRKPIKSFSVEDVSASVWSRQHLVRGQPKTFYSVTVERSYKDRDGTWKYTKSFDQDSLGKVIQTVQQAHEFIAGLMQKDAASE